MKFEVPQLTDVAADLQARTDAHAAQLAKLAPLEGRLQDVVADFDARSNEQAASLAQLEPLASRVEDLAAEVDELRAADGVRARELGALRETNDAMARQLAAYREEVRIAEAALSAKEEQSAAVVAVLTDRLAQVESRGEKLSQDVARQLAAERANLDSFEDLRGLEEFGHLGHFTLQKKKDQL